MNGIGPLVLTIFGLICFWVLFYFGIRRYRLDSLRFQLFTLRNELFLLGAHGRIAFNDPAYTSLRSRINALIRFAHTITLGRILIISSFERLTTSEVIKKQRADQKKARERLAVSERSSLEDIDKRVHLTVAKHVIAGNPILLLLFYVCALFMRRTPRKADEERLIFANKLRVDVLEENASIAQRQEREVAELQPA
jgi:hypothetical protein